jgi:hypothetical protein
MQYSFEDFDACRDQSFLLREGDHSESLQLTEVEKIASTQTAAGDISAFSIVLRSNNAEVLPQQIYHLSNATLGDMQIFIVPIGVDDTGVRYEAIFS